MLESVTGLLFPDTCKRFARSESLIPGLKIVPASSHGT
jgi:hypothetical protein